jgi:HAD superfamily hydrolase (TIGR01662 family)
VDACSLIAAADAVLLDFDGPVCSVFAGYPAPQVADELRDVVRAAGGVVPSVLAKTSDPHAVLRAAVETWPHLVPMLDDALTDVEVRAIATAAPTAGANEVLRACRAAGQPVVVVSNNAVAAVRAYLELHGLELQVADVVGRASHRPDLMKPHPHPVREALSRVGTAPERAVLVGDAVTDVEVAVRCGVPSIGLANKPHKVEALALAGASVVVRSMTELVGGRAE